MLDLDYSDSDASDFEQTKKPQLSAPLLATATSPKKQSSLSALLPKPKLRKQKDPDAPKKIILNLPKIMQDDEDDRPVKKAKLGGGSGLSAMLPAPKRSMAAKKNNDTVASPAKESEDFTAKVAGEFSEEKPRVQKPTSAINTMFVPQSVAKKPIQPTSAFKKNGPKSSKAKTKIEPAKPKISLFGSAVTTPNSPRPRAMRPVRAGEYKPLMLDAAKPIQEPVDEPDVFHTEPSEGQEMTEQNSSGLGDPEAQDLDSLARQMGLGKHEMRQLYGRNGPGKEPIEFATFSVDEEYQKNELERSLGLAEEIKPVRAVAPGRHQLQSLLNAAQSQRGALEESFSRSKSNKKESGSRYGW